MSEKWKELAQQAAADFFEKVRSEFWKELGVQKKLLPFDSPENKAVLFAIFAEMWTIVYVTTLGENFKQTAEFEGFLIAQVKRHLTHFQSVKNVDQ